jgi:nucleotide-binding universal stress UspA family protein
MYYTPLCHTEPLSLTMLSQDKLFSMVKFTGSKELQPDLAKRHGQNRMAMDETETMAMKQILAAVDFSQTTDAVLKQAADLAKGLQAKLWVLHVTSDETQPMLYEASQFAGYSPEFTSMPGDVQLARDLSAEEIKREHAQLIGISSGLRQLGIDAQAMLLKGDPAKLILEKAAALEVEIVMVGSHGHSLLRKVLLGSVSEAIIRHAPCNVMVVPATDT